MFILGTGYNNNAQITNTNHPNSKGFVIHGHIEGIENGTKIYLHNVDEQVNIDTAFSENGHFILTGIVARPTTCWVECKDQYAIIQVENTNMEFNAPINNMRCMQRQKGAGSRTYKLN
ncbi:MAG: DUF4369 domain-containing protein [Chitinophagaceae bacterium]|nr:DUF4369 domain-containing protein [Chitinophagaceae bacterium]